MKDLFQNFRIIVISLNVLSLVLSAILSAYSFQLRKNKSAFAFGLLMAIFAAWSMLKLIIIFNPVLSLVRPVSQIIFAISAFTPSIILYIVIFQTQYPGWFRQKHVRYLFVIPLIQVVIAVTNGMHHLLVKEYSIENIRNLPIFSYEPGVFSMFFQIYLFSALLISMFILLRNIFTGSRYSNWQAFFIFIAIALPAINDLQFVRGYSFIPGYKLTPEFFIFGNLFFAWALLRYRFLNLKPLAHDLVMKNIEDIILVFNSDHLINDINSSGVKFFGLNLKEVIGKPFETLFSHYSELSELVKTDFEMKEICLIRHHTSHYFIAKQSFVKHSGQENIATILILQNITERKKSELQLQKYALELEVSNGMKDKSFRIIANDVKNPFQGLIGYSDFVLSEFENLDDKKVKHIIELINATSKRGFTLLENLVEWSWIQTGTLGFNPGFNSLTAIAGEALTELKEISQNKNIVITNEIEDDVEIFADKSMIYSVFRNLISNAIQFNKVDGTISIRSVVKHHEKSVMIEVSDTGIGMTGEMVGKIFSISGDTTARQSDKGHGLGLLLCKEYVEKNGGTISIESKSGKGTVVFFSIPCLPEDEKNGSSDEKTSANQETKQKQIKYILPEAQWQILLRDMIYSLENEKIYRDPDVTVSKFALHLNTNRTYLSQIINDTFNTNFSNLINEYRLKEVEIQLNDNSNKLTIDAIALNSGFGSKSAYYAAIKKKRGNYPQD